LAIDPPQKCSATMIAGEAAGDVGLNTLMVLLPP
jgi:hypothetical protein